MNIRKRVIAVLLCVATVVFAIFAGQNNTMEETVVEVHDNDSLVVWYTDEALTDFLNSMAVEYHEKYGIRVLAKLQPGNDYIESIYRASIDETGAPDLFITGSDTLEKAYMSGVASVINDSRGVVGENNFPGTALSASTYHNQLVAYPYYFETTVLLYNETYLREMVTNKVQAELSKTPDDDEEAEDIANMDEETLIEDRLIECIPSTFDALLTIADEYDAPAGVETIFKWDVRDIFYNYFFVGNYINIGGANGDDSNTIDIYNIDSVTALQVFQNMNQFFSFESEDVTYEQVVSEFLEGKLIFATVTSDIIKAIDTAKANGEFEYDYGLTMIPDLNEELDTKSLSVTNVIAVNGYSNKRDEANAFAQFLTISQADSLYEKTGKLPVKKGAITEDSPAYAFAMEYEYSVPMPKLMATSNAWLLMEGTFADAWSGADVSTCLKELSEQVKLQLTGEAVSEEYIKIAEDEEEIEYLDEEALKEEAQKEE